MRKLPPLNAVSAFEAAARHISFTKSSRWASRDARSRQPVAPLEDWFGVKLDFAMWLVEAGHETEQFTRQWVNSMGYSSGLLRWG